MGLFPLRGPLVSVAGPRSPSAEAVGSRWVPDVSKHTKFPGYAPPTGHPVENRSVLCPAASCMGGSAASLRGLIRTGRSGIAPGRLPFRCPRSLSESESCEPFAVQSPSVAGWVPPDAFLAGLHGVFDVKEHFRGSVSPVGLGAFRCRTPLMHMPCQGSRTVKPPLSTIAAGNDLHGRFPEEREEQRIESETTRNNKE
jgi:hypothetical protein